MYLFVPCSRRGPWPPSSDSAAGTSFTTRRAESIQLSLRQQREKGTRALVEAGSIGKRYRRMDEAGWSLMGPDPSLGSVQVGTPFCCTVDFDTLEVLDVLTFFARLAANSASEDDTVTVRRRDEPLEDGQTSDSEPREAPSHEVARLPCDALAAFLDDECPSARV